MLSCCSSSCLSPSHSQSQSNLLLINKNNISAASNGGGKVYQQNPVVSSLGSLNCRSRPLFNGGGGGGGGETRRRRRRRRRRRIAVGAVRREREKEREWEEYYEEAVKEKDLALALRLLKQQQEGEEKEKDSSSSIESMMMMIPQLRERESSSSSSSERSRDWEVLDTCLNADDMSLVSSAYSFLHHRGFLPFFGKFRNLVLEGPRDVTPTLLKSSTGLDVSKLSPKKWGLSGTSTFLLPALLASVSFLLNQGLDIRPNLAAILALAIIDSIFLGGSCLAQISTYWPPYRRRVLVHEAGHLLIAYLLGCPIRGVILDPIVAMQMGIQGQAGTQFWDEKLQNELAEGRLSGTSFDRYCMVLFAGIAAEAFVYGEAEGGENDENLFRSICLLLEPPLSVAQMSNQARWSVLQSYNMLKWHKHAHRAAVKALETGGSLSFVIRRIEEAMSCTTT